MPMIISSIKGHLISKRESENVNFCTWPTNKQFYNFKKLISFLGARIIQVYLPKPSPPSPLLSLSNLKASYPERTQVGPGLGRLLSWALKPWCPRGCVGHGRGPGLKSRRLPSPPAEMAQFRGLLLPRTCFSL